jgi:DUF4097 and DUF4098 domain-containing protein YvlB
MKTLTFLFVAVLCCFAPSHPVYAGGGDNGKGSPKTFTVSKGGTLAVSVNIGDIHIRTWEKNEVSVSADIEGDDDMEDIKIRQKGNTISVDYEPEWGESGDIRFNINIPSEFNVTLETSAGDLEIDGNLTGTLKGSTSGGSIVVGSVTGMVDMSTSGGDITTEDIKGDLTLNTSGGDIHVGEVTGLTDVRTSGGDITIQRSGKSLTAETAGGNVQVGDVGGDASVSTSGGDIIIETVTGGATLSTAGGNISLASANGTVKAKTAGGDIVMDDITGSVDAKTSAGNIRVALSPAGAGKSRFSTTVGDVWLYIPENAKATINARARLNYWQRHSHEQLIFSDYKEEQSTQDESDKDIRATYTLNGGGQAITIETSQGNIHILKPGSSGKSPHRPKGKRTKWN